MEYKLVQAANASQLEKEVNQLLKEGWKTIGGAAICPRPATTGGLIFSQAMLQEKDDSKKGK